MQNAIRRFEDITGTSGSQHSTPPSQISPARQSAPQPHARRPALCATLPAPSAILPDIARALDALMPVCPPDPHKRMHPEDLENLMFNNQDD